MFPPSSTCRRPAGGGGGGRNPRQPGRVRAGSIAAMAAYQSLYRRYRSQRFDEVLGQDHITKALRNAVRDERVGHAYLFSGPRGTGKTSTARILAKVLNCDAPEDGEPCGKCENCVAVAEGRVVDWLLEQDAASKSKVDDMRDLLERVPLGTSGNRKVIILDEVHMLSQGAENALLKTLEEPPPHVVFVLATTDPQKVRPTIRSRTQHFEFRLLPPDLLADHVRRVIADAGLLDGADVDEVVDHVVRAGGGSVRDTLSALDQVAALGEVVDEAEPVDAVVDAVCARDTGQVLVAVADALASGRDARTLGEGVIVALRDAFLSVMGAADTHLAPAARDRAATVGEALGPAGLTRALDVLGEALTELARKPDPRVVVEVALVRITQPAADRDIDALLARLDRLERQIADGGTAGGPTPGAEQAAAGAGPTSAGPTAGEVPSTGAPDGPAPPGAAPGAGTASGGSAGTARDALSNARRARITDTPAGEADDGAQGTADSAQARGRGGGRPTLGAVARQTAGANGSPNEPDGTSDTRAGAATTATADAATDGAPSSEDAQASPVAAGGGDGPPSAAELEAVWTTGVLAALPVKIRSKWRGGRWLEPAGHELRFAVPNEWHKKACDDARPQVEKALADHFGRVLTVGVVVSDDGSGQGSAGAPGGAAAPGPAPSPASGPSPGPTGTTAPAGTSDPTDDEAIDPAELRDAGDVATRGVDLVLREFGGELIDDDD
jgi:DNA polymerase-3 subunit gamma/tau